MITSQKVQQRRWGGGAHAKPNTAACAQNKWDSSYKNQAQAHPSSDCSLTHSACGGIYKGQTG
jgi:hypothetical protein